ncbi:sugar ABC transporter permease [Boseongicola sp. H5]|uniref:carbohydrate ABC transporter permease n=1 Tax=Boseongicola sp. H5 TaxID=2763261 RepID=UPI001D0BBDDC
MTQATDIPKPALRAAAAETPAAPRGAWMRKVTPYLFIAPFVISFLLIFVGPALYALGLSFTNYRGFGSFRWVGFYNYVTMLQYDAFWITLRNTAFYWVAHAAPMMGIALGLALLVRSRLARYRRFFKTTIFLPQMIASVTAALVFQNFFGTTSGVLNGFLGMEIPWLTDPDLAPWAVVLILIWRGTGYWFVIFLAGLTSIDLEIEEAAKMDGANGWQRLWRITLPLMKPILLFAFVVDMVVTWRLFAEPNVLLGRAGTLAPIEQAPVLNLVVENIRAGQFGQAAATGWLLFIIIAVLTFVMFKLIGSKTRGSER